MPSLQQCWPGLWRKKKKKKRRKKNTMQDGAWREAESGEQADVDGPAMDPEERKLRLHELKVEFLLLCCSASGRCC